MTKVARKSKAERAAEEAAQREANLREAAATYPIDVNSTLLLAKKWLDSSDIQIIPMESYKDTVIELTLTSSYTNKVRFPLYIFETDSPDEIENKLYRFYDAELQLNNYVSDKKKEAEIQAKFNKAVSKLTREELSLLKDHWSK